MFAEGKKAYFVPSLWEESIAGKIVKVESYAGQVNYIILQTKDGTIIKDYAAKFTMKKPAVYR